MECRTARLLLELARPLPTELEAGEAEALWKHLATCADCGALARSDRAADDRLGQAMRAVPVPAGLRGRLLARLEAERGAWYRRRLVRGAGALAAAAGVVFAVGLALGWWDRRLPAVDVEALAYHAAQEANEASPEQVERWFRQQFGVHTVAPVQFNYALLASYGLADFQGRRVPQLLFHEAGSYARVYILAEHQFNLHDFPSGTRFGSGGRFKVEVVPRPERRVAYVIVYTGESLEPFRSKDQRSVT
jgi:hypothetical protein